MWRLEVSAVDYVRALQPAAESPYNPLLISVCGDRLCLELQPSFVSELFRLRYYPYYCEFAHDS